LDVLTHIYLLTGLLLHKAVWEVMKRRDRTPPQPKTRPPEARFLSLVKVAILAAIIVQAAFGIAIVPIANSPGPIVLAGLALYTVGLLTSVTARIQLGRNWSDIEKSYVKQDHALVEHGLYRYIRHPIYTGDLLLLTGLELALNSWAVAGALAVAIYVRQQAIREERKLLQTLPGYNDYVGRTSRFLPLIPL
jgi:protein-S-isoprenylcysteine O-methyltransferase Ste14